MSSSNAPYNQHLDPRNNIQLEVAPSTSVSAEGKKRLTVVPTPRSLAMLT